MGAAAARPGPVVRTPEEHPHRPPRDRRLRQSPGAGGGERDGLLCDPLHLPADRAGDRGLQLRDRRGRGAADRDRPPRGGPPTAAGHHRRRGRQHHLLAGRPHPREPRHPGVGRPRLLRRPHDRRGTRLRDLDPAALLAGQADQPHPARRRGGGGALRGGDRARDRNRSRPAPCPAGGTVGGWPSTWWDCSSPSSSC